MASYSYPYLSNTSVSTGDGADAITISNTDGFGLNRSQLNTGSGDDTITISSRDSAVYNATVNLGDGNDLLDAQSSHAANRVDGSSIDAGAGDDRVEVDKAAYSSISGGSGKDTIVFSGRRSDWDLKCITSGDESLDHLLSNSNSQIRGFEVFVFDDVTLDLTAAATDATGLSPLSGSAPPLHASISPDLWDGLGFNRLTLSILSEADVRCGDGDDSVSISNSDSYGLYRSRLNTGNGNDSVVIASFGEAVQSSTIHLGDGNDTLNAQARINGQAGLTPFSVHSSTVDAGSGDDTIHAYKATYSTFYGGSGNDTIIFSGSRSNWSIAKGKDSLGRSYVSVNGNQIYGFETIRFEQGNGGSPTGPGAKTLSCGKDLPDPLAPWRGKAVQAASSIHAAPLILKASAAGSQLEGGSFADQLTGDAGNDILIGRRGSDTLSGGGGMNLFILRRQDWFESDRISDFNPRTDKLMLTDLEPTSSLSQKLNSPKLAKTTVQTSRDDAKAASSSAEIVYSKSSGNLYYNANGSSPGMGREIAIIATLPSGLNLSSSQILVADMIPF